MTYESVGGLIFIGAIIFFGLTFYIAIVRWVYRINEQILLLKQILEQLKYSNNTLYKDRQNVSVKDK